MSPQTISVQSIIKNSSYSGEVKEKVLKLLADEKMTHEERALQIELLLDTATQHDLDVIAEHQPSTDNPDIEASVETFEEEVQQLYKTLQSDMKLLYHQVDMIDDGEENSSIDIT
jgi:hypothetical protein